MVHKILHTSLKGLLRNVMLTGSHDLGVRGRLSICINQKLLIQLFTGAKTGKFNFYLSLGVFVGALLNRFA